MGYLDLDRGLYDAIRFVLVELYGLAVRDGFPRLTPTIVPAGIVDGSYMIDERATADFELNLMIFRNSLVGWREKHEWRAVTDFARDLAADVDNSSDLASAGL